MSFAKGDSLQSLVREAFTNEQLKEYALASGDMNKIHLDDSFAQQAGFPTRIVHGMLSMAYLGDYVRYCFPDKDFQLLRLKGRFRKVTFPGDSLTCQGEIKEVKPDGTITVSLFAQNQRQETTIDGEADLRPLV